MRILEKHIELDCAHWSGEKSICSKMIYGTKTSPKEPNVQISKYELKSISIPKLNIIQTLQYMYSISKSTKMSMCNLKKYKCFLKEIKSSTKSSTAVKLSKRLLSFHSHELK